MHFTSVFAVAALATVSFAPANAAVMLATPTYAQDFDSLANNGFSSVLPTGWALVETGRNANGTYRAGAGTANNGDTYSFGAAGSSERALGGIASGTLEPSYGVEFVNGLGTAITALDISYFGELWRAGTANNLNTISFAYSLDASSLTTGTYTPFAALDYAITPGGANNTARNGNANRTSINGVIADLNIAPGASFWLRWSHDNQPGTDHGLAIDDFALSATTATGVIPEPTTWVMLIAGFGLVGAAARRRRVFTVTN